MTLRHAVLAAGAVLVFAVGVYLFIEVRSKPAAAQVQPAPPKPPPAIDEETDEVRHPPAPSQRIPKVSSPIVTPTPTPTPPVVGDPPRPIAEVIREGASGTRADLDPKLASVMDEANKAYDHGDLDDAKAIALRALTTSPGNPRMLRIVVSASCISGDNSEAQKAYLQLPKPDREQMKVRCARYGVTFNE